MTQPDEPYVILAALSFDESGAIALREAARVASCNLHAQLHVVHVYGPDFEQTRGGQLFSLEQQRAAAPKMLREYVDAAAVATTCQVTGHIRPGTAAKEILQAADDLDANMIVLGSHQRGGTGRFMLRHVAESVMRGAHCPVLIAVAQRHAAKAVADTVEPPCPECSLSRSRTHDPDTWCERHSRPRARFHIYVPTEFPSRVLVMGN